STSRWLALFLAALLIVDAALLPAAQRRAERSEAEQRIKATAETVPPDVPPIGTHEDPTLGLHTRITDVIEWLNVKAGEFVAFWALISVFVYYYEVIARFALIRRLTGCTRACSSCTACNTCSAERSPINAINTFVS